MAKFSFPKNEELSLQNNKNINDKINQKTIKYPSKDYIDGPPFISSNYHIGHILVSTVKDTLIKYLNMTGFKVNKVSAGDCHGLPVSMKVIEKNGSILKSHNKDCHDHVNEFLPKWRHMYNRIGRFVDSERLTMDLDYMETEMGIIKQLYDKDYLYEGYQIMAYSTGCQSILSNFEAKLNYKEVLATSVIIKYQVNIPFLNLDYPAYILVWTTTPWSIPCNMAICTKSSLEIVCITNDTNEYYIVSKNYYLSNLPEYSIVKEFTGDQLKGLEYIPTYKLKFPTYKQFESKSNKGFRIITDDYVSETEGTGFVNIAPAYGQDDFRVCCDAGIIDNTSNENIIEVLDNQGKFNNLIEEYSGIYFKDVEKLIIDELQSSNRLFKMEKYKHSYPYCYRTDTPLIYKLEKGYFLNVSKIKDQLIKNAENINWEPNCMHNKYVKWLSGITDWSISRTVPWGMPLCIWKSEDEEEVICIGSLQELKELTGMDVKGLHTDDLDGLIIKSKSGKILKRVNYTVDVWMDSAVIPYVMNSQNDKDSLAEWVTESSDQVYCWFYVMNVISNIISDKNAFKNVIVTGLVLGNDGSKMSKSKGNYTSPDIIIDKYGADALRLYLLSTPLVKGESYTFNEQELSTHQKHVLVKLYNMTTFLVEKIQIYNLNNHGKFVPLDLKVIHDYGLLEKWILSKSKNLIINIRDNMDKFKLAGNINLLENYIEDLSNLYLRLNREKLKDADVYNMSVLYFLLDQLIRLLAPIIPYLSEKCYHLLAEQVTKEEHVFLDEYPNINEYPMIDESEEELNTKFNNLFNIITLIRELRNNHKINNKRPLKAVKIWGITTDMIDYIKDECNIIEIEVLKDVKLRKVISPKIKELKEYLKAKGQINKTNDIIKQINRKEYIENSNELRVNIDSGWLGIGNNLINIEYQLEEPNEYKLYKNGIFVEIDTEYDEIVHKEHMLRLVNTSIQNHRKILKMKPWELIKLEFYTDDKLREFIEENVDYYISSNLESITYNSNLIMNDITEHSIEEHKILFKSNLI